MESTFTAAKFYFLDIPLVDWKDLANFRTAGAVSQTIRLFCQPGAGKQQVAAGPALPASPFTARSLFENIPFLKMGQPEASQLAAGVI